jgi:hypothetical protein
MRSAIYFFILMQSDLSLGPEDCFSKSLAMSLLAALQQIYSIKDEISSLFLSINPVTPYSTSFAV